MTDTLAIAKSSSVEKIQSEISNAKEKGNKKKEEGSFSWFSNSKNLAELEQQKEELEHRYYELKSGQTTTGKKLANGALVVGAAGSILGSFAGAMHIGKKMKNKYLTLALMIMAPICAVLPFHLFAKDQKAKNLEKNGPEMKILEEQIRQLDEQIKILNQMQSDENYNVNG